MTRDSKVSRKEIGRDEPIRLEVAAVIAFPDGSMKAGGLRRERDKGTLEVERICNRDYTTLSAIDRMRERCLVKKEPGSISSRSGAPPMAGLSSGRSGSSETAAGCVPRAALHKTLMGLKEPSRNILQKNIEPTERQNVTQIKSESRTC